MKWLPPNGSTQGTQCGKYVVVKANDRDWVAYDLAPTTGKELAVKASDELARKACEDHEDLLASLSKRA